MKKLFYLQRERDNFLISSGFFCLASSVLPIDSGISSAIHQSLKLTMIKVLERNGRTEMSISTEKEQGKRNSIGLWKKNGFFSSQISDFS